MEIFKLAVALGPATPVVLADELDPPHPVAMVIAKAEHTISVAVINFLMFPLS
jgi:hypothetical protein